MSGLIGAAALALIAAMHLHLASAFAAATSVLIVAALSRLPRLLIGARRRLQLRPQDLAFRDRDLDPGEYSVEIALVVEGRCIGVDRGIVAFEDGLFSFHGSATSFSLAAADFRLRGRFDARDPYLWLPRDALVLRLEDRRAYLRLIGVGDCQPALTRDLASFFHLSKSVAGPRQWPPLTVLPSVRSTQDFAPGAPKALRLFLNLFVVRVSRPAAPSPGSLDEPKR